MTLSISGLADSLGKGEQRDVVFSVSDATGIEAFDLQVKYDPSRLRVVGIESTGSGSALELASHDTGGLLRRCAVRPAAPSGKRPAAHGAVRGAATIAAGNAGRRERRGRRGPGPAAGSGRQVRRAPRRLAS